MNMRTSTVFSLSQQSSDLSKLMAITFEFLHTIFLLASQTSKIIGGVTWREDAPLHIEICGVGHMCAT